MTATKTTRTRKPVAKPAMVRVQLVREAPLAYGSRLKGPDDAVACLREVLDGSDRERFICMHLSTKHDVLSVEVVSVGTLSATLVHPREVFKGALLANAASIIVAHNHPSGDPTPSPEDLALTRTLMDAGEILGIRVIDHVVIGHWRHVSIRETSSLWLGSPFHNH